MWNITKSHLEYQRADWSLPGWEPGMVGEMCEAG